MKWYLLLGFRQIDHRPICRKYEVTYRPKDLFSLQDALKRFRLLTRPSCLVIRYEILTPDIVKDIDSRWGPHATIVICETPEDLRAYVVERCRRIHVDDVAALRNERVLEITHAIRKKCEDLSGPVDITRKKETSKSVLLSARIFDKWWLTPREEDDY